MRQGCKGKFDALTGDWQAVQGICVIWPYRFVFLCVYRNFFDRYWDGV